MTTNLTPDEVDLLDDMLDIVLDRVMRVVEDRIEGKADEHGMTVQISMPEKAKIRSANLILNMARNYSPEAKLKKFVDGSNKILPHLTRIFNEQAMLNAIPPEAKDEEVLALCDKAGATAIAGLIRKSMQQATPGA